MLESKTFLTNLRSNAGCGLLLAGMGFLASCSDKQEDARAKLDTSTPYEFTVDDYIEAASLGQIQSVDTFLEAGMNVDAEDSQGNTALLQAARSGQAHVVEHLLGKGADATFGCVVFGDEVTGVDMRAPEHFVSSEGVAKMRLQCAMPGDGVPRYVATNAVHINDAFLR